MKKIDYTISDKTEIEPVGYIVYLDTKERIEYFSEKALLDDFSANMNCLGYGRLQYGLYQKENNLKRYGIDYALKEKCAGEFGLDLTKEEYEEKYINRKENTDIKD